MKHTLTLLATLLLAVLAFPLLAHADTPPVLGIRGGVFTRDGEPFQMWGIRVASATTSDAQTEHLVAQLDDYAAHGLNAVTVFYQGSSGAHYDPFTPDGRGVEDGHQRRMERIITECGRRGIFVIVGIFYQHARLNVRDADAVRAAVRLVTEKLKAFPNVLINVANEQNNPYYDDTKRVFDFRDPERIIELCRLVKETDPKRLVGGGGYDVRKNIIIGQSPAVDALLFDFTPPVVKSNPDVLTGRLCEDFVKAGVTDKPLVNVELLGAWTKELPRGIFPEHARQRHFDDIASVLGKKHIGLFFHNSPWCQGEPMRYDLAGQGTKDDPGIRWYFDYLKSAIRPCDLGKVWESVYRVDPQNPYQLVNGQGRHLFIVNKTAWAYFACVRPEVTLDRCRQLGVNVVRVALEGTPYPKDLGMDLWPWGGTREQPDWGSFNEQYWSEVERRIELAGQQGVGVNLCLYYTLKPKPEDAAIHRAYWEQCLRRLGKYANVLCWEIQNEYLGNEGFQDAAGMYFASHDPHGRPVITSAGTTDGAAWPGKPWVAMAINHTCTGAQEAYTLDGWYLPLAQNLRAFGKPAWCNESGREKRHGNDDGVYRRKQGWLWSAAGCFWTWHSWDGCEGIDDAEYAAPGQQFVRPMAEFFRGIEFWRLHPYQTGIRAEAGVVSATLADEERQVVVAYFCTQDTGARVDAPAIRVQLPEGRYEMSYVSPVTGEVTGTAIVLTQGLNRAQRVALPAFTDDLVIVMRRLSGADAGPVPGTR